MRLKQLMGVKKVWVNIKFKQRLTAHLLPCKLLLFDI